MTVISDVNHCACLVTAPAEGTDLGQYVFNSVTLLHLVPVD